MRRPAKLFAASRGIQLGGRPGHSRPPGRVLGHGNGASPRRHLSPLSSHYDDAAWFDRGYLMFAGRESMSRTPGHDDERVLENFVDLAGRLISIPVQHKKRLAVLKWLVEDFQPGRLYPEPEVNRGTSRRHPDFASLRGYLFHEERIHRPPGGYWSSGTVPHPRF